MAQAARGAVGAPSLEVRGRVGWGPGQPGLVRGSQPMAGGLELADLPT